MIVVVPTRSKAKLPPSVWPAIDSSTSVPAIRMNGPLGRFSVSVWPLSSMLSVTARVGLVDRQRERAAELTAPPVSAVSETVPLNSPARPPGRMISDALAAAMRIWSAPNFTVRPVMAEQ